MKDLALTTSQTLALSGHYRDIELVLPDGMGFDEWESMGHALQQMAACSMWWLGDWLAYGEANYSQTFTQAADIAGCRPETARLAKWVAEKVPRVRRRTELTYECHKEVAAMTPDNQISWLAKAAEGNWKAPQLRKAINRAKYVERVLSDATDLPVGPFNVLLADPPWAFDIRISHSRKVERQYPTMQLDEIKALDVNTIAADNCLLFLWCPITHIREALEVIDYWGFDYRTHFVWVKSSIGSGHWLRAQHEDLLLAVKGEMPTPSRAHRRSSVIEAPRGKHSEKPIEVYEMIEAAYSEFPKCELFARNERPGWESWGNEAKSVHDKLTE